MKKPTKKKTKPAARKVKFKFSQEVTGFKESDIRVTDFKQVGKKTFTCKIHPAPFTAGVGVPFKD